MLKSLVVTLALLSVAAVSSVEAAQPKRWTCAMTITKGGCPLPVYLPEQPNTQHD
jgi:hypothetical protein